MEDESRVADLRALAESNGLWLRKVLARDTEAPGRELYWLADSNNRALTDETGADLDFIESVLRVS